MLGGRDVPCADSADNPGQVAPRSAVSCSTSAAEVTKHVAGAEQLVRAVAGDAGDRPRHRADLASELSGFDRHPKRPRPCANLNNHCRG